MSASDQATGQDAMAALQLLRGQIDVTRLSAADREVLSEWWSAIEGAPADELEMKEASFAGFTAASMFYDPAKEGLEPSLIPVALAIRAFDAAIGQGLPGAEHSAEGFLRDCGFDESVTAQMLQQMVSRAPLPNPDALN